VKIGPPEQPGTEHIGQVTPIASGIRNSTVLSAETHQRSLYELAKVEGGEVQRSVRLRIGGVKDLKAAVKAEALD
jgi:hypothetical protein